MANSGQSIPVQTEKDTTKVIDLDKTLSCLSCLS